MLPLPRGPRPAGVGHRGRRRRPPEEEARIRRQRRARAPGLRGPRQLEGNPRAGRVPRREPDEVRAHARAAPPLPPDRDRLPHGAGGPGRRAARVPAVVPGRRGDRFPRREHPARLRRDDLRRRAGQRRVPARVRRAPHRDHPRRPHRERVHRADRRDAEPRGSRCDPHARHGSDRPARAAARDRVARDAAAADVHRDDRGPARRPLGGRLQPRHPAAGLPGAHGGHDRSAAFPRRPVEGAAVRDRDRVDRVPGRPAGRRHGAIGGRTHDLQRRADRSRW